MDSIYASQGQPRLPLASEAELQAAADAGLLEETHFLDLKRELKPGKGENRESARDLASFAVDSGTVIVGVEEGEDSPVLVPRALDGLAERIEQIATMIPDPPLSVICRSIPSTEDPAKGVRRRARTREPGRSPHGRRALPGTG